MSPSQTTSRSTLKNKILSLVGFKFSKHPIHNGFIQLSIYSLSEKQYVFCVSEGPGSGNLQAAKDSLGKPVLGELIAPFAQRFLEGVPFNKLKEGMEGKEGMDKTGEWHWYK